MAPAASEQAYRDTLRQHPHRVDVWIALGLMLRKQGRFAEAEACYRESLRIDSDNFLAAVNLGNVLCFQRRFLDAVPFYEKAAALNPRSVEAHSNLGRALLNLGSPAALHAFIAALELNPDYFDALEGIGICLHRAGRYDDAYAAFSDALRVRPQSINVRLYRARTQLVARSLDEAEAQYENLVREHPQLAPARSGLAAVLTRRGQYDRPRALFEEALALKPDDLWTKFNYALFLLRAGQYGAAWDYYDESRWQVRNEDEVVPEPALNRPTWRGETLVGKTLLIACEQGLGDEIMFASIFNEVRRQAAHCILECDHRLEALFHRSFPDTTVVGVDRKEQFWHRGLEESLPRLPAFDYWTYAGSLPRYYRRAAEDFPRHSGYLAADPSRVAYWKSKLDELGPGLKIGIGWRGGTALTSTRTRSVSLEQLRPMLSIAGAHFVSLQYDRCADELQAFRESSGVPIHHWPEAISDYDETAALVSALDLVVCVCTSLVHLGGSLGQPVWVLAPVVAEWRYGREGPAMIWYPSVRVFRQPSAGAWDALIDEVTGELRALVES